LAQTKKMSLLESVTSTTIGLVVGLVANALILPLFGFDISLHQNLVLAAIYTVISIARGFCVRRLFEWWGSATAWRV
jgi:uncharacterized membrane protein YgaE (UPF0421/DUF939 family)